MFAVGVFSNRWLLIGVGLMVPLQLAFTYMPIMNGMLDSAPIGAAEWFLILGIGVLIYGTVGFEKSLRRRTPTGPKRVRG